MPKRRTPPSSDLPFHITARSDNREPFPGDLEFIWKTFSGELLLQHRLHEVLIHAFLLIPNHFHLMVTSPNRPIGAVMRDFLGSATRIINHHNRRSGHLTGGPYFGSLITDPTYYLHCYKYVLRNPVRAELCRQVSDYPFSSYGLSMGNGHLPFPLHAPNWSLDLYLPQSQASIDAWLNKPHKKEETETIRKALRKKVFKIPVNRTTRKPEKLDL